MSVLETNPREREDACSCWKPAGAYGRAGWHLFPRKGFERFPASDCAYEPCGAYRRQVEAAIAARKVDEAAQRRRTKGAADAVLED